MSNQNELKVIAFGQDVEEFLTTDLGKYMVRRAEEQRETALNELATVDPTDAKSVMALQFKVQVADGIQQFFADAITEGHAMAQQLDEQ